MRRDVELGPAQDLVRWIAREGRAAIGMQYVSGDAGGGRSHPPINTGGWFEGLRAFITPGALSVTFRNTAQQAIWTEQGRNPGYAPVRRLAAWAAEKFDLDPSEAYAVGRAVARDITRSGFEPENIMKNSFDEDFMRRWEGEIRKSMDDFLTDYGFTRQG